MKLLGHAVETMSPPALDVQTAMLLESSDARRGVTRSGGSSHRRSMSLGGSIDLSVQSDASPALFEITAENAAVISAAESAAHELRILAEHGSSEADVAVEAAANYVVSTSAFLPQLTRCEMLLSIASCDDLQSPSWPSSHVAPLVDLQLPVSVQEFFLCFISDDHHFNTKVMNIICILPRLPTPDFLISRNSARSTPATLPPTPSPAVPRRAGQLQHMQHSVAGGSGRRPQRPTRLELRVEAEGQDGAWKVRALVLLQSCLLLTLARQHVWSERNTLLAAVLRFSVLRHVTLHHSGGGLHPYCALR